MKPSRENDAGKARKAYSKPVLKKYGAVRTLTRNTANKSDTSDGGGQKSKTG